MSVEVPSGHRDDLCVFVTYVAFTGRGICVPKQGSPFTRMKDGKKGVRSTAQTLARTYILGPCPSPCAGIVILILQGFSHLRSHMARSVISGWGRECR